MRSRGSQAFAPGSERVPARRRRSRADALRVPQVDLVGRLSHRQLPQRRERRLLEEALHRALDLLRRVDDAALESVEQGPRRQVDQHDLVGLLDDPVRYRLPDLDARDLLELIVQALQVLHVHGREHVDARVEQDDDVLPALGPAPSRGRSCAGTRRRRRSPAASRGSRRCPSPRTRDRGTRCAAAGRPPDPRPGRSCPAAREARSSRRRCRVRPPRAAAPRRASGRSCPRRPRSRGRPSAGRGVVPVSCRVVAHWRGKTRTSMPSASRISRSTVFARKRLRQPRSRLCPTKIWVMPWRAANSRIAGRGLCPRGSRPARRPRAPRAGSASRTCWSAGLESRLPDVYPVQVPMEAVGLPSPTADHEQRVRAGRDADERSARGCRRRARSPRGEDSPRAAGRRPRPPAAARPPAAPRAGARARRSSAGEASASARQPVHAVLGRGIDELDLVGGAQERLGDGLLDRLALIASTCGCLSFDVLQVDRGDHRHPGDRAGPRRPASAGHAWIPGGFS